MRACISCFDHFWAAHKFQLIFTVFKSINNDEILAVATEFIDETRFIITVWPLHASTICYFTFTNRSIAPSPLIRSTVLCIMGILGISANAICIASDFFVRALFVCNHHSSHFYLRKIIENTQHFFHCTNKRYMFFSRIYFSVSLSWISLRKYHLHFWLVSPLSTLTTLILVILLLVAIKQNSSHLFSKNGHLSACLFNTLMQYA